MLKLTYIDGQQSDGHDEHDDDQFDGPSSLLFPVDAIRRLSAGIVQAPAIPPAIPGRTCFRDPIRDVEEALERVESDFLRLRAQFGGDDDRPRAA